jgi:hypothetical protein
MMRPVPLQNETAVARTCVGKKLRQVNGMTRENAPYEVAEDKEDVRVDGIAVDYVRIGQTKRRCDSEGRGC